MSKSKWLSTVLVTVLVAVGPLGPITAMAQMPAAQPAPGQSATAPPSTGEQMPSMQPPPSPTAAEPPSTGAKVGAGALNVVYVPGKAILCGMGTIAAGAIMIVTFGSAHREAASFFNEGCSGSWLITPQQAAAASKEVQFEY